MAVKGRAAFFRITIGRLYLFLSFFASILFFLSLYAIPQIKAQDAKTPNAQPIIIDIADIPAPEHHQKERAIDIAEAGLPYKKARINGAQGSGAYASGKPEALQGVHPPPDINSGDEDNMEVSVTFDGGSEDNDAALILSELRQRNIKTTIFLTGEFIKRYPHVARQIVRDGHEVGNHTMRHPHLTDFQDTGRQGTLPWIDRGVIAGELKETEDVFFKTTGHRMSPLWRAPFGEINAEIRKWAYELGYLHVGWTRDLKGRESLDSLDWVSDRGSPLYRTPEEIKAKILNFNKARGGVNGGIILMHLSTERTTDRASGVLGEVLDELGKKGYRFVKVSELIRINDPVLSGRRGNGGQPPAENPIFSAPIKITARSTDGMFIKTRISEF